MTWWQEVPMRLVQTNLREIDLPFDPAAYARTLADAGANVALFNLGGIVANYPTRLPYHYHNPRLEEDLVPELIRQLQARGIRLIGRFDFSKVNQVIGAQHPDWLYRSLQGEVVTYNGQMQCCVNGAYQQECSLAILAEALELYPLDGVFFNMIGYQVYDYSGVYHGICQCRNCQQRFYETTGLALPRAEDRNDPAYRRYLGFCHATSRELFYHIRDTIKSHQPDCATCTYISDGIDIVRSESNSGIRRPQPEFVYDASYHIRRVRGSWPGLAASNAVVHFIDFPYRHAAVTPALTARRLAQNFIHGGWLDYYVIGHLYQQHDRACLPAVRQVFQLHRQAQDWLVGLQPLADVCLVEASPANPGRNPAELRGMMTLLSEAHILYDVVEETALMAQGGELLARYPLIILPDIPHLAPELVALLEEYVQQGGRLLLSGQSGSLSAAGDPLPTLALTCAGVSAIRRQPHVPGAYFALLASDRPFLPQLADLDWIPADTSWLECTPAAGTRTFLRQVPVGMYGPPEKCYYTEISDHPGILLNQAGQGACAVLPWQAASQYDYFPTHAIAGLFHGLLENILRLPRRLEVEAPPVVELSAFYQPAQAAVVIGLANLSGQHGRAVHPPLPLADLRFELSFPQAQGRVESLIQGELSCERLAQGRLRFTLPRLDLLDLLRVR